MEAATIGPMLRKRLVYGSLLILLLLGLFALDNWLERLSLHGTGWEGVLGVGHLPAGLGLMLVFFLAAPLVGRELARIFRAKGLAADPPMFSLVPLGALVLVYILPANTGPQITSALIITLLIAVFLIALVRHSWQHEPEGAVAAGSAAMFTVMYLGLIPSFYLLIREEHSAWVVAALIFITKTCDIGAYFVGRWLGKHKLIPWLSPGKTWEGLIGGMLTSAAVAALFAAANDWLQIAGQWQIQGDERVFIPQSYDVLRSAIAGLLLGLAGQAGDLTASLFKRDAGLKDSGQSVPGFGGVIDVVDSVLGAAPVAYWLLLLGRLFPPG